MWASLQRETRNGRTVAVKTTTYDARLEADGLKALARAGAPVPHVYEATSEVLVMDWVSGRPDWYGLGAALASVHRSSAPAFGYSIDNMIGGLAQPNGWDESWATFFVSKRIEPHLEDPAVPDGLRRRLGTAIEAGLFELLDAHDPSPSLVHGDLWAGNIIDGRYLIDPAVSYSDREIELAFMAVFGGIPEGMWQGYLDAWPLPEGWQSRRPALQLHHLLVHVRLFGGGYISMVEERLDRLGW